MNMPLHYKQQVQRYAYLRVRLPPSSYLISMMKTALYSHSFVMYDPVLSSVYFSRGAPVFMKVHSDLEYNVKPRPIFGSYFVSNLSACLFVSSMCVYKYTILQICFLKMLVTLFVNLFFKCPSVANLVACKLSYLLLLYLESGKAHQTVRFVTWAKCLLAFHPSTPLRLMSKFKSIVVVCVYLLPSTVILPHLTACTTTHTHPLGRNCTYYLNISVHSDALV